MSDSSYPCPDCGEALTVDFEDVDPRTQRARSTCECGFRGRTLVSGAAPERPADEPEGLVSGESESSGQVSPTPELL